MYYCIASFKRMRENIMRSQCTARDLSPCDACGWGSHVLRYYQTEKRRGSNFVKFTGNILKHLKCKKVTNSKK